MQDMEHSGSDGDATAPQHSNFTPQAMDSQTGLDLGGVYRQCSNARVVGSNITVTRVGDEKFVTENLPVPRIGSLDWTGDDAVLKTFHGGRISKNGRTTNECISASFDPRNLQCLGCDTPHSILSADEPVTLVFSDQNFLPFLSGGPSNCIGIVRGENFTLGELGDIAAEILDKKLIQPGSVLLFGSASNLYRVGASNYINEWIHLVNRCSQRWPCVNICPLVPVCRSDCPGDLVREIEMLASWLGRIYANSTSGLLDSWRQLLRIYQATLDRSLPAAPPAVFRTALPTSLSLASLQPHTFVFKDPVPDAIKGLDSSSTVSVVTSLLGALSRDFSVKYNAEVITSRYLAGIRDNGVAAVGSELKLGKHVVVIGASNMRRLVPVLTASGFTVTDLSRSSWLATEENISSLISSMTSVHLDPGFSVILELFSNSTFRFLQFDGSLSLPFKDGAGYHMGGDVTVCDDGTFLKLLDALKPVLISSQSAVKIIVPPLPRYIFHKCCRKSGHAANVDAEGHSIKLLDATSHFRELLVTSLRKMGVENFFVIDGVAGLLGFGPGERRPANADLVMDLKPIFHTDGVHYSEIGYRNLAKTAVEAMAGTISGTLKHHHLETEAAISTSAPPVQPPAKKLTYNWRGFSSPVGSRGITTAVRSPPIIAAAAAGAPPRNVPHPQSRGGHHTGRLSVRGGKFHPYHHHHGKN
jgi:hypothetical protein